MCMQLNAAQLREQLTKVSSKSSLDALVRYLEDTGIIKFKSKHLVEAEDDYIDSVKFLMGTIMRGDIVYVFNSGLGLAISNEENRLFQWYKVNIGQDGQYVIDGLGHSEVVPAQNAIRIRPSTFDMAKIEECFRIRFEAYTNIRKATEVLISLREA